MERYGDFLLKFEKESYLPFRLLTTQGFKRDWNSFLFINLVLQKEEFFLILPHGFYTDFTWCLQSFWFFKEL